MQEESESLSVGDGKAYGLSCSPQKRCHFRAKLLCCADLPKLKALWHDFHDAYDVEIYVVPTSPITSRPIDDVEPYTMHNGHKVNALCISSEPHTHCTGAPLEDVCRKGLLISPLALLL